MSKPHYCCLEGTKRVLLLFKGHKGGHFYCVVGTEGVIIIVLEQRLGIYVKAALLLSREHKRGLISLLGHNDLGINTM